MAKGALDFGMDKSKMLTMIRKQLKIFNAVISFITIFMVNNFRRKEITTKMLFHDNSMLKNIIPVIFSRMFRAIDKNITFILIMITAAFPRRIIFSGKTLTIKIIFLSGRLRALLSFVPRSLAQMRISHFLSRFFGRMLSFPRRRFPFVANAHIFLCFFSSYIDTSWHFITSKLKAVFSLLKREWLNSTQDLLAADFKHKKPTISLAFIIIALLMIMSNNLYARDGWFSTLQEPSDVDKTRATDGQILMWDDTIERWMVEDFTHGAGFLKLDCSNDPLTAALDVYGAVSSYDPGHTQYSSLYHDGSDIMLSGSAGDITLFTPSDVNVLLSDSLGASFLRIQDSGVNTVASVDSNGLGNFNGGLTNNTYPTHLFNNRGMQVLTTGNPISNYTEPNVIYESGIFKMWYRKPGDGVWYATSADGYTFTPIQNVIPQGADDQYCPFVTKIGATYYCYAHHAGYASDLDLWTSADGITWALTKVSTLPRGVWDATLGNCFVWLEGVGDYRMLYEGTAGTGWKMGYATSADGQTWAKSGSNPVYTNAAGTFGGMYMQKSGTTYYVLGQGSLTSALPTDLYMVKSTNLTTWTPTQINPIFIRQTQSEGVWQSEGQVGDPTFCLAGSTTFMYYEAVETQLIHNGFWVATSPYTLEQICLMADQGLTVPSTGRFVSMVADETIYGDKIFYDTLNVGNVTPQQALTQGQLALKDYIKFEDASANSWELWNEGADFSIVDRDNNLRAFKLTSDVATPLATFYGTATIPTVNFGSSTGVSATAAAGVATFTGLSGFAENMTIDLAGTDNTAVFSGSITNFSFNSVAIRSGGNLGLPDNSQVRLGSSNDSQIELDTAETNDSVKWGVFCNSANQSGNIIICDSNDINTNFGVPQVVDPHLRIQSSDATTTSDYIQFYHDQTNPVIEGGNGPIILDTNSNADCIRLAGTDAVNDYADLYVDADSILWLVPNSAAVGGVAVSGKFTQTSVNATAAGPTDNFNVGGANIVFVSTAGNNVTIGGFINGYDGQVIHVVVINATNNTTLEHAEGTGNQDIYLSSGADETRTAAYGGWTLVCNGTSWFEVGQ